MFFWSYIKTAWIERSGSFWYLHVRIWLTKNCNTHFTQHLKNKGNQTMKYDQLIEYNMRNIFFQKSYRKYSGELFPDPCLKYKNWAYLWINSVKFLTVCFYCMLIRVLSKYSEIKLRAICFYSRSSFFKKQKVNWS